MLSINILVVSAVTTSRRILYIKLWSSYKRDGAVDVCVTASTPAQTPLIYSKSAASSSKLKPSLTVLAISPIPSGRSLINISFNLSRSASFSIFLDTPICS